MVLLLLGGGACAERQRRSRRAAAASWTKCARDDLGRERRRARQTRRRSAAQDALGACISPPPTAIRCGSISDREVGDVDGELVERLVDERGRASGSRASRANDAPRRLAPPRSPSARPPTRSSSGARPSRRRRVGAAQRVADLAGRAVGAVRARGRRRRCPAARPVPTLRKTPGSAPRSAPQRGSASVAALTSVCARRRRRRRGRRAGARPSASSVQPGTLGASRMRSSRTMPGLTRRGDRRRRLGRCAATSARAASSARSTACSAPCAASVSRRSAATMRPSGVGGRDVELGAAEVEGEDEASQGRGNGNLLS